MTEPEKIERLEHQMRDMAHKLNMKSDGNGGWIARGEASQNTEIALLKKELEGKDTASRMLTRFLSGAVLTILIAILGIGRWVGSIDTTVINQADEIEKNSTFVAEWPRTGELPSDVNQNTKIQYLEEQLAEERKYRDILYGKYEDLDSEVKKLLYSK